MKTPDPADVVPCADPRAQYVSYRDEIDAAVARVLGSGRYVLGDEVAAFESAFAAAVGVRRAVGVGNGTDAITVALRARGIGAGDEVITVSHTAVATVSGVEQAGATPVLVDVDPETRCLTADGVARAAGPRTKAVIPVHIYGHPAPMPEIMAVAEARGLFVLEDCAQAHGATIDGKKVGSFGHAAAFSFYPTKNLGAIGDGGAVVTDDDAFADEVELVRQYGWRERYLSVKPGGNSRLDELQAAILSVKLPRLAADNLRRSRIAAAYDDALRSTGVKAPTTADGCTHAMHLYVVETDDRDEFRRRLGERGVQTALHYPFGVHQQPAYRGRGMTPPGGLPVTERLCRTIVTLPLYPELSDDMVGRVTEAVRAYAAGR